MCKLWSGFMYEMSRQIGKACDIPVVSFDGDQADRTSRVWSARQISHRLPLASQLSGSSIW